MEKLPKRAVLTPIGFGLGLVTMFAPEVLPDALKWTGFICGVLLIVFGLWPLRPDFLKPRHQRAVPVREGPSFDETSPHSAPPNIGWLSLEEAGKALYGQINDDTKAEIARAAECYLSITGHCKAIIVDAGAAGVIELQGRREVGLVHESIPSAELGRLQPDEGASDLGYMGEDAPAWFDVQMCASELPTVLFRVESGDSGHASGWYELWGAVNWFQEHASARLKEHWETIASAKAIPLERAIAQSMLKVAATGARKIFRMNTDDGRPTPIDAAAPLLALQCFEDIQSRNGAYSIREDDMERYLKAFEEEAR